VRLLLIAGFLGSGKTTVILSLARRIAASGQRICVLVNELGEVGIDGEVLRVGELRSRNSPPAVSAARSVRIWSLPCASWRSGSSHIW
jgi:G3E family GTPase